MSDTLEALCAAAGAVCDSEGGILHFGAPADERRAALDTALRVPLAHLSLLRAQGEEAAPFLHNLLTNDIKNLKTDQARLAGFCTAKGRLLASLLVWRQGDDYLLQLPRGIAASILRKLSMFVLRAKVRLSDVSAERPRIGLAGPQAAALLQAAGRAVPEADLGVASDAYGYVIRLGPQRFIVSSTAEAGAACWRSFEGARSGGEQTWRWLDILAGLPGIRAETQEEFVPQMVNYELIGGVSFKKGCYPGQEIVARTQYLGKLKRRMYRAHVGSADAAPGQALYSAETGEQSCGALVDAVPSPEGGADVLAVATIASFESGAVSLGSVGGPRLVFGPLPYPVD